MAQLEIFDSVCSLCDISERFSGTFCFLFPNFVRIPCSSTARIPPEACIDAFRPSLFSANKVSGCAGKKRLVSALHVHDINLSLLMDGQPQLSQCRCSTEQELKGHELTVKYNQSFFCQCKQLATAGGTGCR